MQNQSCLVSIVLITYNSSEFIIDALNSCLNQKDSFKLELIVSDDCSTDNTVSLCQNWLDENNQAFFRTKLITSPVNTGTPSNCQRGLDSVSGLWIRFLAGDDILMPNGIQELINHEYSKLDEVGIIVSDVLVFKNIKEASKLMNLKNKTTLVGIDGMTSEELTENLCKGYISIPGVHCLYKTSILKEVGGFDLSFRRIEDTPLIFKIIDQYDIRAIAAVTYGYRQNDKSVTNQISLSYWYDLDRLYKVYIIPRINKKRLSVLYKWDIFLMQKSNKLKISGYRSAQYLLMLSPVFYMKKLKKL